MTTQSRLTQQPGDSSSRALLEEVVGHFRERRDILGDGEHLTISAEGDVVAARQAARTLAAKIGFSTTDQTIIATAVSEITRNILEHANRGELVLGRVQKGDEQGISIVAGDQGPGIADISLAMQDGYSTKGELGLGLSGAKRLMDEFDIISEAGKGTTVTMKKWKR